MPVFQFHHFEVILFHPPGLTSLNQANGSTPVEGEGCLNWCIEDIHGKHVCLHTKGYHVPSASIRLFSPQCYIQEQKGHAKLTLNSKGIDLTLGGGSVLRFPIGTGNNLPFMLTVKGLNQQRKRHGCPHSPTGSSTSTYTGLDLTHRTILIPFSPKSPHGANWF